MKNQLAERQTLAELLASSVLDLFPKAQLLFASSTRKGFFADFIFPDPIAKEQLSFIQQRMREKIAKFDEVKKLDMMGESLAHFMKDQGQVVGAAFLHGRLGEVLPVIQIDHYAHICEKPFAEEIDASWQPKLESIIECEPFDFRGHEEQVTRLQGVVADTRKVKTHQELGKGLFSFWPAKPVTRNGPVEIFWHGEGSKLFSKLISKWRENNFEQVRLPPGVHLKEYLTVTEKRAAATICEENFHDQDFSNGLLDPQWSTSTLIVQRLSKNNVASSINSLLQFFSKTYKMLDLKWHAYLTVPTRRAKSHDALIEMLREAAQEAGIEPETKFVPGKGVPRISLRVKDIFDKEWTVSTLKLEELEGEFLLSHKLFTSIERLIALLLENGCICE